MIAADTSSLVAYLAGDKGSDVETLDRALVSQVLLLPPMVITEVLSDPKLPSSVRARLMMLPLLPIQPGYWGRAGAIRARLLSLKLKARIGDALIAQSCIDHNLALITRDTDFRHFAKHAKLMLA
jgi:predicted nucleic acid-binding protein